MEAGGIMNKKKNIGILLCIIGAVMLLSGGYIILRQNVSPSNEETTANATTDAEELVTEDSNSEEKAVADENIITEGGDSLEEEQDFKAAQDSEQNTKKQQSAHEINPDVYKWPCGDESFQDWEEPEDVIYFAKNKELFDAIVKEFSRYEGQDVNYIVSLSDGELWETDDGVVAVEKNNTEDIKKLLQDEYINYIYVYDRGITFGIKNNDFNNLIYSFNNEIDPCYKVNISLHWWWQTGVGV